MNPVRLEKRNPEKNQFRFYRLDLQPTLFGEWSVVREWGRIGRQGRVVTQTFADLTTAEHSLKRKVSEKLSRGYL